MIEFARTSPNVMEVAGDLIAKAQDWPMKDEFAERLRPPGAADAEDMTPEDQQQAAQAAQLQQQMQAMEMEGAQAELEKKKADARKANAEADKAEAEAERAKAELALEGAELAGLAADEIVPAMPPMEGEMV
jgi:hypothetical protein